MKDGIKPPSPVGKWILTLSLLGNCFGIGLAVAPFMPWAHDRHFGHHAVSIDQLTDGLPDVDARKLREVYTQEEAILDQSHETLKASTRKISKILADPTPNLDELGRTLDDIAEAQGKTRETMADLVKHAATDLSPQARLILSERGWQGNVRH